MSPVVEGSRRRILHMFDLESNSFFTDAEMEEFTYKLGPASTLTAI